MTSIEQQITELRNLLNDYNHKYYVENSPVVSDYEFDTLLRQLQDLEDTAIFSVWTDL